MAKLKDIMARLGKLEPAGFLLVFMTLAYAFGVLPPRSALLDIAAPETHAAWASVAVSLALVALRYLGQRRLRFERLLYALFLAGMPFIYVAAAWRMGSGSDVARELVGVPIYVGLAAWGYSRSFPVLGLGIAAHGLGWDFWHQGSAPYIASWYPLACLVIDLALGFLAITQASAHEQGGPAS